MVEGYAEPRCTDMQIEKKIYAKDRNKQKGRKTNNLRGTKGTHKDANRKTPPKAANRKTATTKRKTATTKRKTPTKDPTERHPQNSQTKDTHKGVNRKTQNGQRKDTRKETPKLK
jgi:hypothetical protein